ncbi:Crp/Fnr family transcriptional regulator [Paracoccus laeviglucosivorans]|uniref:cAMP-binding domain of CRP or a regulatory subunit of cAMP-dependent protein kinases n=1 Tax=Paracoccus laeviglucosivorans TaxID=1197861 RepID=A0A521EVD0_9RHOB|nr:Crp/Fnr family transcriptional regulator [Paracoccus laeviglucosivorans]SMO87060.1 cAMP-binding domain of CRP or a regulatory subunit of cAMP-dependent protein kinases [Paracoccus laeviglucosivorans]
MTIIRTIIAHLARTRRFDKPTIEWFRHVVTERMVFGNDDVIMPSSGRSDFVGLVLRGMAVRLQDVGKKQTITALYSPGQIFNADAILPQAPRTGLRSKGISWIEFLEGELLRRVMDRHPDVERLLWSSTAGELRVLRGWLIATNSLRASERLAHFLCEIALRSTRGDITERLQIDMPLRQREIADLLGYTAIHVNRAARELRDRGLIHWEKDRMTIFSMSGLVRLARFEPDYLQGALSDAQPDGPRVIPVLAAQ